ncbi:MAG: hypothetical protein A2070_11855 [Bdellovibrionales bacterium GWC1_52_8]|nr:MAG: hypothetical protein A2Z97_00520 [Bdellovibrionales bacterium GWB1_52_6]OFZ03249.1 MAG: hypothetical protein A2X97_10010 [Bdellovibrionales bacterium GWA1_52_35]OFZ43771.1 MAG: hypothetical protein A2070_11855 [Bdellovibrionales bacterium GWC1_52_8]
MVFRPLAPYPVKTQILFAISFVAFLLVIDRIRTNPSLHWVIWTWCVGQVIIGIQLVRLRIRAKKSILRCLRCS